MDLESELTNKFLNGEMSFADYSLEWYGKDEDDNTEDIVNKAPVVNKAPKRRKCSHLTPNLLGLMGEANLRCARGELQVAEKMCHEIIRQVPRAPEPYQTLALIYEDDPEKALQFSLFAAHLSPSDADEWLRLANLFAQRKDPKQEVRCLTNAIRADPAALQVHIRRLEVLQTLQDMNLQPHTKFTKAQCYHKIVSSLPSSEGAIIMDYAKKSAKLYHENKETYKALQVTKEAYDKCSALFQPGDVNLFLELLMTEKEYETCMGVFVASAGVELEADVHTVEENGQLREHTNYLSCHIPNNVPIDLRSKLIICLVHLKAVGLVDSLLDDFLNNDVESAPDLYMDIEEALTSVGDHRLALKFLEPLVGSTKFDLGAVWLKHAECLYNLGKYSEAIDSYYKVVNHAPLHIHARQRLFELLEKVGRTKEAVKALQQDHKLPVSAQLMFTYLQVLKQYDQPLQYLQVGEALLSKSFPRYRHSRELNMARMVRASMDLIHNFRTMCGENIHNPDDLQFHEGEQFKLTPKQEWDIFNDLLKIAYDHKKFYVMERLSFGALMSKNLFPYRADIDFLCLQSAILNNDSKHAFPFVREIVLKHPNNFAALNLLNFDRFEGSNYGKFLTRLFQKEDVPLTHLFFGNNYLNSGRYLVALRHYTEYLGLSADPLAALLAGMCLLVLAAQRKVERHHSLILQGLGYLLTYKKQRKCDHESYYNFGRAFQMLHINNLAIEYYEKALSSSVNVQCQNHKHVDLTREIAYNMYVIYKEHSPDVARMYLHKYIVI